MSAERICHCSTMVLTLRNGEQIMPEIIFFTFDEKTMNEIIIIVTIID